jgi:hypothetical protein
MSIVKRTAMAVIASAGILAAAEPIAAQTQITGSNWMNHPRIVAIREIVVEIDSLITKGSLKSKKTEQGYSGPYIDDMRQAFFDSKGKIRKLVTSGGSEDSSLTFTSYYDKDGRLRFVYIVGGAVNGTGIQHRIYLDAAGAKIWEIQKLVEGPGYTFPAEWPLEQLVFDPAKLPLDAW